MSLYSLPTPPPCPIVPCQSRRPSGGVVCGVVKLAGSRGSPRGERMYARAEWCRCGVASKEGVHSESPPSTPRFPLQENRGKVPCRADVVRPPKADCVRRASLASGLLAALSDRCRCAQHESPATPVSKDEDHALPLTSHRCPELGRVRVERRRSVGCLRAASSSLRGWNHLCSASQRRQGRRRAEAGRLGKLDSKKTYAASLVKRAPDGGR